MERVVIYTPAQDFFYNTDAGSFLVVIGIIIALSVFGAYCIVNVVLKMQDSRYSGQLVGIFSVLLFIFICLFARYYHAL